ncbi:sensor histidine kinase, partial [[Clostridium] symbiosum]|nr:sensor histidine kinase [[Clostridium] symbiosum]
ITYVNLLKKEGITEEERRNYIRILDQKSMRLKSLIEDLYEISKANSNNVTLHLVEVDIVSLMKQVRLELEDKIRRSQVEFRWNMPDDKAVLILDSEKTY